MIDLGDLALRLAIDLAAVAALVYGLFHPRHGRMDLVVDGLFNVGVFLAPFRRPARVRLPLAGNPLLPLLRRHFVAVTR